jgi:hypothetical protein
MTTPSLPGNSHGSNRHPVDQLAEIRAQIKALQDHEAELKEEISSLMGSADSLGGAEFIAIQKVSTRKGAIDTKAMEKAGIDPDKFRKADVTVYQILVERREVEVAE